LHSHAKSPQIYKKSLLAVTGAGFISRYYHPNGYFSADVENQFIYRTLGRTGIKLPIISMGTNNTSNNALIRTDLDIKCIDATQYYTEDENMPDLNSTGEIYQSQYQCLKHG